MLRVLLKIDRVCIRIKEAVELFILVKKGQKYLTYCKRKILVNGQLVLDKSIQFFITAKSPFFEIEIYLVKGTLTKHGGVVTVDLRHFAMNASHQVATTIEKTPLANSTIHIDFIYMMANHISGPHELLSQEEVQSIGHLAQLNEITKQNEHLKEEKMRLDEEIKLMQGRNTELEGETRMIEQSMEARQKQREREIMGLQQERDSSLETLARQKKRIAEIVDIINLSGNYELIKQVEGIINENRQKWRGEQ